MTNSEKTAIEQYVNMPELLARVENDRELLAELLALFLKDYPRLRDALHHAIHESDAYQVEKAAHALKGMLANLSIKNGAELAAAIETAARAGNQRELEEAAAAFDRDETGLLAAVGKFMVDGEP